MHGLINSLRSGDWLRARRTAARLRLAGLTIAALALAALWMAPIAARSLAEVAYLPLGVWAMIAVLILFMRRTVVEPSLPMVARASRTNAPAI